MHILDDLSTYKSLDIFDMYLHILSMPDYIQTSYFLPDLYIPENHKNFSLQDINQIVICGMGGSAISGDIAKALYQSNMPITVVKDFQLPYIDERTLAIFISYSGNTGETINCLKAAMQKTKYIMAITSGGILKEMVNGKYIWIEVPSNIPPRAAIGQLFFSLVRLFELFCLIESQEKDVHELLALLSEKRFTMSIEKPITENVAKARAEQLHKKIPVIYSGNPKFDAVAYRIKCQINENAKHPAFYHVQPEMMHNEIEAWESPLTTKMCVPIFISEHDDHAIYTKRRGVFQQTIGVPYIHKTHANQLGYLHIFPAGQAHLVQIFDLIYAGDILSYYLAILNEVDPTEIRYINIIKNSLK